MKRDSDNGNADARLLAILGMLTILSLLLASCGSEAVPKVGTLAPDFTLPTLEGETIRLSDFRGQPVLLNFWATWCGPCRYEMPFLQTVHEQAQGEGLAVLAVNIGEGAAWVRNFIEILGFTFTVPLDERRNVATRYRVGAIPTSLLIDGEGVIRLRKVGAFARESELWLALQSIM